MEDAVKTPFAVAVQEVLCPTAPSEAHSDSLVLVTYFQSVSALCRPGLWLSSGFPQHCGALPFLKDTDKHS